MEFLDKITKDYTAFFHTVQATPLSVVVGFTLLLIAGGLALSAGVEWRLRIKDWKGRSDAYIHSVLALGALLVALAEQTLPFVQNSWFVTTIFGTYTVAVLSYLIRMKSVYQSIAKTWQTFVNVGAAIKSQGQAAPATVSDQVSEVL
jgi:hypothetical protein